MYRLEKMEIGVDEKSRLIKVRLLYRKMGIKIVHKDFSVPEEIFFFLY